MTKKYKLPDGSILQLGSELQEAPELYFTKNSKNDTQRLHDNFASSVFGCSVDIRSDLHSNVCLAGGSTLLKGFKSRCEYEFSKVMKQKNRIQIISPINRKYSAWLGGSFLSSSSTFQSYWITQEEYDESGPGIIHRKSWY